jgi:hypothetical protein
MADEENMTIRKQTRGTVESCLSKYDRSLAAAKARIDSVLLNGMGKGVIVITPENVHEHYDFENDRELFPIEDGCAEENMTEEGPRVVAVMSDEALADARKLAEAYMASVLGNTLAPWRQLALALSIDVILKHLDARAR